MDINDFRIRDFFKGKNILVTGGNGYLGSNLINILKDIECRITILDRIQNTKINKSCKAEITEFISDLRSPGLWNEFIDKIDIIFYFAGQTSVYKANENPKEDFEINVLPIFNLLETCRLTKWNPSLIFSGTVTVTGIPEKLPVDEMTPDNPVTVYDLHKQIAENYLKYYSNQGIIKNAILRLANVYGPGPISTSADRGILNMMARKAINCEDLTLYGKGDFLRDYIFIDDVISSFLLAAVNINIMKGRHYLVASGVSHTVKEAFEMVIENTLLITGKEVKLISVAPPLTLSLIESRNFVTNISSIKMVSGWSPKVSLKEGIIETIKFYYEKKHKSE
jgi:nucleoside-diphosphate-sugar epimerase